MDKEAPLFDECGYIIKEKFSYIGRIYGCI